MYTFIVIVHVLACLALIVVVLLQKGKGADLGAAFGGSSQTVFGGQGAGGFLTKVVAGAVGVFLLTSLSLTYISSHRLQATVMEESGTAGGAVSEEGATGSPSAAEESAPAEAPPAPAGEQPAPAPEGAAPSSSAGTPPAAQAGGGGS